ncbi:hypothetical protein CRE_12778 [Caenorhabditis remanei]|uniref:Nematode cuticle collagen N-terminal domain-containing protein n=1 Tax=Caenorhabditis remanei TaxID=31234 RepID=E3M7S8_CAERE|nr:hypothetical protein CRE_12778 [Caenorhabditis remanei]
MEKILVTISTGAASIAVLAVLFTVPSLYNTINEVHDQVLDGVSVFRVETDSAWTEMMDIQVSVTPPTKATCQSIQLCFQSKRQTFSDFSCANATLRNDAAYCACPPRSAVFLSRH